MKPREALGLVLDLVNEAIRKEPRILREDGQNYWLLPDSVKLEIERILKEVDNGTDA